MRAILLVVVLAFAFALAPSSASVGAQACAWSPSSACPAPASSYPHYPCYEGQIKGNWNSMIYHLPSHQYYGATGSGRTSDTWCFDTESDAQYFGFRRAFR